MAKKERNLITNPGVPVFGYVSYLGVLPVDALYTRETIQELAEENSDVIYFVHDEDLEKYLEEE